MYRNFPIVLALIASVSRAEVYLLDTTKPKDADPFFRIHSQYHLGFKWGFVDKLGNIVIAPQFADEGYFFDGLARVVVNGLSGFINESGRIAIPARYQDAGDFHDGLAPVRVGKKWGYIDKAGKIVIAPAFLGAAAFRQGLARVEVWEKIRCLRGGQIYSKDNAPDYVYGIQSDIRHGMNNTCFPLDSKVGYIDKSGRFAIPLRYLEAHDFFEGLAAVRLKPTGKYGFIDRNGAVVIDFQFDEAGKFSEGLAWVRIGRKTVNGIHDPGQCGYVDHTGRFVVQAQFGDATDFSEGLAAVSFTDRPGRGFINRSGTAVIPVHYVWAEAFSEGLAQACDSWSCFYIDHADRRVLTSFQALGPFSGGLAIVRARDERGRTLYVDKTGRLVAPVQVEAAHTSKPVGHHK